MYSNKLKDVQVGSSYLKCFLETRTSILLYIPLYYFIHLIICIPVYKNIYPCLIFQILEKILLSRCDSVCLADLSFLLTLLLGK